MEWPDYEPTGTGEAWKSNAMRCFGDVSNDRKRNCLSLNWICSDRDGIAQTGPDQIGNSIV